MKKYQFTGHLSPLPPGVKHPLQLSGEVYLVSEVDQELELRHSIAQREIARLNAQISKLLDTNRRLKKGRALQAGERHET